MQMDRAVGTASIPRSDYRSPRWRTRSGDVEVQIPISGFEVRPIVRRAFARVGKSRPVDTPGVYEGSRCAAGQQQTDNRAGVPATSRYRGRCPSARFGYLPQARRMWCCPRAHRDSARRDRHPWVRSSARRACRVGLMLALHTSIELCSDRADSLTSADVIRSG